MTPRAMAVFAAALVAWPASVRGAFEIRDTSPAALGAASMDLQAPRFFDSGDAPDAPGATPGLRCEASHAALYEVEGLSGDRIAAELGPRILALGLAVEQVGGAGAMERTARFAVRERSVRAVSLEAAIERLDLFADGEPRMGGWTLSGAAEAGVPLSSASLEVRVEADRVVRSAALDEMGVRPSFAMTIRVRMPQGSVALLDRWEWDGRRSPRLFVEVPLGGAALIRLARGESPGRTGAALAVRIGRLDAAAGRLDLAWGSAITGLSLGLLPGPMRWRER